jgi:hypothetical protein
MLFLPTIRWQLLRLGVDALASGIAFDPVPTSAHRSRGEHLRNGLGALLFVASEVGLHKNLVASCWRLIASCWEAARDPARSELRYGLSELRRAEPWTVGKRFADRHPVVLAVVTAAALGRAGRSLGRMA